eukprot:g3233.t1
MERLGKLRLNRPGSVAERSLGTSDPPPTSPRAMHSRAVVLPPAREHAASATPVECVRDEKTPESCAQNHNPLLRKWIIGQPVDVAIESSGSSAPVPSVAPFKRFRNATILNIDATSARALLGFRIYHESGPFTESRDPRTKGGRNAMRLAQIVKMNSGVSPPPRYYGLPGEHWRFLCDLAPLGSRARDLLDEMGDFSRDVMQSLSRRMLRHSRDLANDERGMNAMDKAMAAFQAVQGPLYFFSSPNGKHKKFDSWRAKLSNSPTVKHGVSKSLNSTSHNAMPEKHFVPSLTYNGDHVGYRYELKHLGLGYYPKEPDAETLDHGQNRQLQIRDRRRELQACTELIANIESEIADNRQHVSIDPQEQHDKETNLAVMREREIDLRVQLGMLLRQEIESMWEQEKKERPPLADEHQCGPLGAEPIAMIREALEILRGALLIDSQNASARLNSIELAGMLPVMVRSEMFGASFTFDNVYAANPDVFPEFVRKRVPRSKFYDENYRLLRSYGGHDLPASAWLNSAVRRPGETKDALRKRANAVVLCIQRCFLRRYRRRSDAATRIQTMYRKVMVYAAVERKVLRSCGIDQKRRFWLFVYRHLQKLLWRSWQAVRIQRLVRGIAGRMRATRWFKGILRLQGLGRAIKSRRLAGVELVNRLARGAKRDADERRFVAMRVREAVEQVDAVLASKPHGRHMIKSCARRLRREARTYWTKRVALRARLIGSSKSTPILQRARLAATFSKFDWHKSGRIGLRALKALIVDELCIPMSPEDFVRLGALLDDRVVGGVSGTGGAETFLLSLASGEEDGPRGLYVTFSTFYKWWASRNGLKTATDNHNELEAMYENASQSMGFDSDHAGRNIQNTMALDADLETGGKPTEEVESAAVSPGSDAKVLSENVSSSNKPSLSEASGFKNAGRPTHRAAGGARIAVVGGRRARGHLQAVYALRTKRAVRKICSVVGCTPELMHQGGHPKFFAWNIGGVRGQAREVIIAKVVDRVFKDATTQFPNVQKAAPSQVVQRKNGIGQ